MPDPVDIDVVSTHDSNLAADKLKDDGKDPIMADDIKGMVDRVLSKLKQNECIKTMTIHGHGSEGSIEIGGKRLNGRPADWEDDLKRLKDRFCPEQGVLILNGCHVGAGQAGADKLSKLATMLGVTVKAPTGLKQITTFTFAIWTWYWTAYEDGNSWQQATPDKKPEPIRAPTSHGLTQWVKEKN